MPPGLDLARLALAGKILVDLDPIELGQLLRRGEGPGPHSRPDRFERGSRNFHDGFILAQDLRRAPIRHHPPAAGFLLRVGSV